jgi:uncharacterized protein (DUF1684 family)
VRTTPLALALVAACAGVVACSSGPGAPDDATYVKEIETARAVKDQAWRESDDPVPPSKRDTLLPLRYFPPDINYSVPGQLKLSDDRPEVQMPTSTGELRRMEQVGVLEFTLQGQPMTLGAFVEAGTRQIQSLFVPFADLTTGKETYSAGRYLDLHPTATGIYTIDFNLAYNPTCAYNETYSCPYPPRSNRLEVAVLAGEKAPGS